MWGTDSEGEQSGVPTWNENINFPNNSVMCKFIWTNSTTYELDILKGAPSWSAVCYH